MTGYCEKGFRQKTFAICEENNSKLQELQQVFSEYDRSSQSFIVNMAISLLHNFMVNGKKKVEVVEKGNRIIIQNPIVNINAISNHITNNNNVVLSLDLFNQLKQILELILKIAEEKSKRLGPYNGQSYNIIASHANRALKILKEVN